MSNLAKYQDCEEKTPTVILEGAHHGLAPFVKLKIEDDLITVSNRSAPDATIKHSAIITNFEYGTQDGFTARFTIQDQQEGTFSNIVQNVLTKVGNYTPNALKAEFTYGWIRADCSGATVPVESSKICGILLQVESNYVDGKFFFDLVVRDIMSGHTEHSNDKIKGEDGENTIPLKQAIEDLLTKDPAPKVGKVLFKGKTAGGGIRIPGFMEGGDKGPKSRWPENDKDKLKCVREWLSRWPSDKGLPWTMVYNDEACGGEVIIWEDSMADCDEKQRTTCRGHFLVGGGNKSSVLSFNPRLNWHHATVTHSGAAGTQAVVPNPDEGGKGKGRDNCNKLSANAKKGSGQNSAMVDSDQGKDIRGPASQDEENKSIAKTVGRIMVAYNGPIEGDLTIIGNTKIIPPSDAFMQSHVSIAFVNPFYIEGQFECNWAQKPVANTILSNRKWSVKSVTHKISSGSFTTTLHLFVAASGSIIDEDQPHGGDGSEGFTSRS